MGHTRSALDGPARALHPGAALLAVLAGITAMLLAAGPAGRLLGLRPALVISELGLVAPGLILAALLRRPLGETLALGAKGLRRATLVSLGFGATLWLASLGLFEIQYGLWAPPPGYLEAFQRLHEALRPSGPFDALVSLAAIAIAPAVCEEVLFRGLVLPALLRPLGAWGAACASALLFGAIHLDFAGGGLSLYRVPFAALVGLGLAGLRLRAGALGPAILAHAALNAITFAAAPFADDPSLGLPEPRPGLGLLLFTAGAAASLGLLRRFPAPTPASEAPASHP